MSTEIRLTQGYSAIVDDEDAELAQLHWQVLYQGENSIYARGATKGADRKSVLLHRIILGRVLGRALVRGEEVDHIDGNGLNNRRSNLRLASRTQNNQNKRRYCNNRSGYKGVHWNKQRGKWQADIRVNGKLKYLGRYSLPEDAYAAYCVAAATYFGNFFRPD